MWSSFISINVASVSVLLKLFLSPKRASCCSYFSILAGILLAPQSGEESQEDFADAASDFGGKVKDKFSDFLDEASDLKESLGDTISSKLDDLISLISSRSDDAKDWAESKADEAKDKAAGYKKKYS